MMRTLGIITSRSGRFTGLFFGGTLTPPALDPADAIAPWRSIGRFPLSHVKASRAGFHRPPESGIGPCQTPAPLDRDQLGILRALLRHDARGGFAL